MLFHASMIRRGSSGERRVLGAVAAATLVLVTAFASIAHPQGWSILHWFEVDPEGNPNYPESQRLTYDGSLLYGTTANGGFIDCGVIFSIGTDGQGFKIVHLFQGGAGDGRDPAGHLTLDPVDGVTLYGTATRGGDSDNGVVFSVHTDGSNHALLHEFAGGLDDGRDPRGSLIWQNGVLYGMTRHGGDGDDGVVYSIRADGSRYEVLHEFSGGAGDGRWPNGYLTADGSTLFGMTEAGGTLDYGVIFRMETDGGGFAVLHEFAGGSEDGRRPIGSLALSETSLYGMTRNGGAHDDGVVFQSQTDGTGYSLMRSFGDGGNDGAIPMGTLTLQGRNLIGTTANCVEHCAGTLFSIRRDGAQFVFLHRFAEGAPDAETPLWDSPTIVGSDLFGMTSVGSGTAFGTLYRYEMLVFADGFELGDTSAWPAATSRPGAASPPAAVD